MTEAAATLKRLLVIYHSRTGASEQMAQAVWRGAHGEGGVEAHLRAASAIEPSDALAAAGYVFVAPENLGSLSGPMKDFFDRCYYPLLDQLNGRPYALIICAGSDGQGAVRQVERIVTGWRLRAIAAAQIVNTAAQTPAQILAPKQLCAQQLARGEELGAAFAAGLATGIF